MRLSSRLSAAGTGRRDRMLQVARQSLVFLCRWRRSVERRFRRHWGVQAASPALWGSMAAFIDPGAAAAGFAVSSWFLCGGRLRALSVSAAGFAVWALVASFAYPHLRAVRPLALAAPPEAGPGGWLTAEARGFRRAGDSPRLEVLCAGRLYQARAEAIPADIHPGQRLLLRARFEAPRVATNQGEFDPAEYFRSRNLRGILHADSLAILDGGPAWRRAAAGVRRLLEARIARIFPPDSRGLARALLLGDTQDIDPDLLVGFRDTGLYHLLAISGQHIGVLTLVILRLLCLLRLPRKAAFAATAAVLAVYVPVTGASVSVVRSALMFWCLMPALLTGRPAAPLNNLSLALVLCLAACPYRILSLGFQLSFCATWFLILYAPAANSLARRRGLPRPLGYVMAALALSLVAFAATFPILASRLNQAAPLSVPANILASPLAGCALASGVLALLGAWPWSLPGESLAHAAGLAMAGLDALVTLCGVVPGHSVWLPAPGWGVGAALYVLLLILPPAGRSGLLKPLLLAVLALAAASYAWQGLSHLWTQPGRVTMLDVGQGEAILLELPGADILVDAGPGGAGRNVVLPHLRSRGIRSLDMVILTHADYDHAGGLASLLPHVKVRGLVHPGRESGGSSWKRLREETARRGIPVMRAGCGDWLYRSRVFGLRALSPCSPVQFGTDNDNSLVMLLRAHDRTLLLTGDIESPAEGWLVRRYGRDGLRCDVLKVAHHGGGSSSGTAFLRASGAALALISAGRNSRYGHPSPPTLERLRARRIPVLCTAWHGAVTLEFTRLAERWRIHPPRHPERNGAPGSPAPLR